MKKQLSLLSLLLTGVLVGCSTPNPSSSNSPSSSSEPSTSMHTHTMEYHQAVEGTCIEEGTVEYYYCQDCDKYFADEQGTIELSDLSSGYGPHQFGEWINEIPATCEEDGVAGHKDCSVCEKHFDAEGNEILDLVIRNYGGHNFQVKEVLKEPTYTEEGLISIGCINSYCQEEYTLKVLPLPKLTLVGKQISWNAVTGAEGYNLNVNGVVIDLATATSIIVTEEYLGKDISIQAYTTNKEYMPYGGSAFELTKGDTNLLSDYNCDFELKEVTIKAHSNWQHAPYGNFTNQDWWVVTESDGNSAAKMQLSSGYVSNDTEVWTIGVHKDLGTNVCAPGTFTVAFDYKLSEIAAENSESRTIYANVNIPTGAGFVACEFVSLNGKEAGVWYHGEINFTKEFTAWQQLVMFYHTNTKTDSSAEDYILIDNIEIHNAGSNTNIDNLGIGTFENFKTTAISTEADKGQWICANTVYIENDGVGSGVVVEDDGNQALKMYSTNECASVSIRFNPVIARSAFYYLSLKVKLSEQSELFNLGFRAFSDGALVVSDTQIDVSQLNSSEYTKVEFLISTTGIQNAGWFNFFIWSFANNNVSLNENNYVLIDDIEVYTANL